MAKKILVVDDSAAIRQSITYVLEQDGYTVISACDGQEGFEKISSEKADLIITDVNMPRMNGIEFIKKVRGGTENKFVPILVLTTESQDIKMQEGKEAGATGWIVKPFSADKLISVVKKVIG